MRIMLINGPPRSGKDSLGAMVADAAGARVAKFATALKEMVHRAFCPWAPTAGAFEDTKDMSRGEFFGKTPREVYIAFSEHFMKPLFGDRIFGKLLADDIAEKWAMGDDRSVIITDSGFVGEAMILAEQFGHDGLIVVQVSRPGTNFAKDSRSYITLPGVRTIRVENDGDLSQLQEAAVLLAKELV